YTQILPNLLEIRARIDQRTAAERYQKMKAVTYILDVYAGIRVTDLNGSIPYSEAMLARYEDKFNPVFDPQQQLFNTWLARLDDAIATLYGNEGDEVSYGYADLFHQSDWTRWTRLTSKRKLRRGVRLARQDNALAQQIHHQVRSVAGGPIDGEVSEVRYRY